MTISFVLWVSSEEGRWDIAAPAFEQGFDTHWSLERLARLAVESASLEVAEAWVEPAAWKQSQGPPRQIADGHPFPDCRDPTNRSDSFRSADSHNDHDQNENDGHK